MKKAEAEILIVAELRRIFAEEPMGSDGGLLAFNRLRKERPDLFHFRTKGDVWQTVKGWMNQHKLG